MIVDKNGYHYNTYQKDYVRDDDGNKIPTDICLCHAYIPSECVCAYNGWGNYEYDESDY